MVGGCWAGLGGTRRDSGDTRGKLGGTRRGLGENSARTRENSQAFFDKIFVRIQGFNIIKCCITKCAEILDYCPVRIFNMLKHGWFFCSSFITVGEFTNIKFSFSITKSFEPCKSNIATLKGESSASVFKTVLQLLVNTT